MKWSSTLGHFLGILFLAVSGIFVCAGSKSLEPNNGMPADSAKRITGTIKVDNNVRHYVLHVPQGYKSSSPVPLVLVLHGARGTPRSMEIISRFHEQQNRAKFITVYPAAEGNFWDDGRANVNPQIDDVKFINALVDTLEAKYSIDKKAVFAAGMSNGGTMAVRLACESKKIKAVASVASTAVQRVIDRCRPAMAKSAMFIKGTRDPIANFNGVERKRRNIASFNATIKDFLAIDDCTSKYRSVPIPDRVDDGTSAERKRYENCGDHAEVVSIVVENGGHTWPGAPQYRKKLIVGRTSQDFSASTIIWNFFKQHIP